MADDVTRGGTIIDAGDMSADIDSLEVDIQGATHVAAHAIAANDTHVGTLEPQQSLDQVNWVTIGTATAAVAGAAAVDEWFDLVDLCGPYFRFKYTFVGGAGTLTVKVFVKRVF